LVLYDMTVWLGIPCLNGAIIDVIRMVVGFTTICAISAYHH